MQFSIEKRMQIFHRRKLSNLVNNLHDLALKIAYQDSKSTLKELLNPFHATDFFIPPENIRKRGAF